MQNFVGQLAVGIRERGGIITATGEGRAGFVDAALLDPVPHNTDHLITGPEALNYTDAAAIIGDATGRIVRHRAVTTAEMTGRFVAGGLSPEYAAMLAGLDEDIRHGAEARVSSTVQDVTGRPARSLAEFVTAHRHAFVA